MGRTALTGAGNKPWRRLQFIWKETLDSCFPSILTVAVCTQIYHVVLTVLRFHFDFPSQAARARECVPWEMGEGRNNKDRYGVIQEVVLLTHLASISICYPILHYYLNESKEDRFLVMCWPPFKTGWGNSISSKSENHIRKGNCISILAVYTHLFFRIPLLFF